MNMCGLRADQFSGEKHETPRWEVPAKRSRGVYALHALPE